MHRFINFIFYQVWCCAYKTNQYTLDLFDANPPLKEVMTSLAYDHTDAGDRFSSQIQSIFQSFSQLKRQEVAQFKRWYQGNNEIERVCANDPAVHIIRYIDIPVKHKSLGEQLAVFFKGLYSQSLLDLKVLREKIDNIDNHYHSFSQKNNAGKCPFCGITDLLGEYNSKRDAYDHYLPKALYPFNSINFHNLVPACHICNSSYKTSKDPAFQPKNPLGNVVRRKVFYPFSAVPYSIDVSINLKSTDVENLKPDEIEISFGPSKLSEEIDTWREVYGIDERYKAKCCSQSDGKYWLTQMVDEWQQENRSPADYLNTLNRQAKKNPFAENNFLKKPFLEACERAGLFNEDQLPPSIAPAERQV